MRLIVFFFLFSAFPLFSDENREITNTYKYYNLNEDKVLDWSRFKEINIIESKINEIPSELNDAVFNAPGNNLTRLVNYLTEWTNDDFLKVKSIHDWICENIEYDVPAYEKGEIKLSEPLITLVSKKAVCGGYSMLFLKMTQLAGFESFLIKGFTKGKSKYAIGSQKIFTRHAWNGIKINDAFYLVDTTWDAGFVNTKKYFKRYSTSFFLSDPEIFIKTHYPEAPGWLLTDKYYSLEDFKKLK